MIKNQYLKFLLKYFYDKKDIEITEDNKNYNDIEDILNLLTKSIFDIENALVIKSLNEAPVNNPGHGITISSFLQSADLCDFLKSFQSLKLSMNTIS